MKESEPVTYAYYHQVKQGIIPKTAPSYIGEEEAVVLTVPKYKCTVCGYVYDQELGGPDGGIKPGHRLKNYSTTGCVLSAGLPRVTLKG